MAFGKKKSTEEIPAGDAALETSETGGKKKPLMFIVLAVAAVVVFTCTLAFGKKISAKDNGKKAVVVEKGSIIELDEFLVNLTDEGSDHFLKITLALEFTKESGKTAESFKEDAPEVRDAVLSVLCRKSRADVSTDIGKDKMKDEIKDAVNKELGQPEVMNVYYVNFVTQ